MAYENKNTPAKQKMNAAGHDKQMAIIKEETGWEVTCWRHEGAKDLAEFNSLVAKVDKSKGLSADRDRGLSL